MSSAHRTGGRTRLAGNARPVPLTSSHETGFFGLLGITSATLHVVGDQAEVRWKEPGGPAERWVLTTSRGSLLGAGEVPLSLERLDAVTREVSLRLDDLSSWTAHITDLVERLLMAVLQERLGDRPRAERRAGEIIDDVPERHRSGWERWLRRLGGVQRLELALAGFFESGGSVAQVALRMTAPDDRCAALHVAFGALQRVAMICAPGLGAEWQAALLEYAGPEGRGDLFAVLESAPTLAAPDEPDDPDEPVEGPSPGLMCAAEVAPKPFAGCAQGPTDAGGFGAVYGPWLWVANPASTRLSERYILAPPSGHVAGMLARIDDSCSDGITLPSDGFSIGAAVDPACALDAEAQAAARAAGVNPLVRVPGRGIRVLGERTTAQEAEWARVAGRRTWLLLARSLSAGMVWAGRAGPAPLDAIRATLSGFLEAQASRGLLDHTGGPAWSLEVSEEVGVRLLVRPVGVPEPVEVIIHRSRPGTVS